MGSRREGKREGEEERSRGRADIGGYVLERLEVCTAVWYVLGGCTVVFTAAPYR